MMEENKSGKMHVDGCMCGGCQGNEGNDRGGCCGMRHGRHGMFGLIRLILRIILLIIVFWAGFRLGEIKGIFYGDSEFGGSFSMSRMMRGGWGVWDGSATTTAPGTYGPRMWMMYPWGTSTTPVQK